MLFDRQKLKFPPLIIQAQIETKKLNMLKDRPNKIFLSLNIQNYLILKMQAKVQMSFTEYRINKFRDDQNGIAPFIEMSGLTGENLHSIKPGQ